LENMAKHGKAMIYNIMGFHFSACFSGLLRWHANFQTGESTIFELTQENRHGQLGLGDFVSSATPKPIASLHSRPVVRVLVRKMWKEYGMYGYLWISMAIIYNMAIIYGYNIL
jgi:hypothetical protein